jgi:hypothetical protein
MNKLIGALKRDPSNSYRQSLRQGSPVATKPRPMPTPAPRPMPQQPDPAVYAGGSPRFNEATGQYNQPQPARFGQPLQRPPMQFQQDMMQQYQQQPMQQPMQQEPMQPMEYQNNMQQQMPQQPRFGFANAAVMPRRY